MFLTVNEISEEASYQLGPMTRAFVLEQVKSLDQFPSIKERVTKYKTAFFPDNPILSRLRANVEALLQRSWRFGDDSALRQAVTSVSSPSLSPKITEDPRFNSLRGYVAARQTPPKLDDAREFFRRAMMMKYEPEFEYLKAWYFAEIGSGHGQEQALRIANFICQGKRYSDSIKQDFLSRKASILFNRGREHIHFDPAKGVTDLEQSLLFQLQAYSLAFESASARLDKIEEYSRNTAYVLFQFLAQNQRFDDLIDTVLRLVTNAIPKFDPIEEPVTKAVEVLALAKANKADLHRYFNRLTDVGRGFEDRRRWYDHIAQKRLLDGVTNVKSELLKQVRAAVPRR
jgi:hypothetical protein